MLELAREVRQLIVNRSTGRFDITFEDHLTSVDFSDGTIVTPEQVFFPCFKGRIARLQFPHDDGATA